MAIIRNNQRHGFHLVDPSSLAYYCCIFSINANFWGVLYMHGYIGGDFLWKFGIGMILFMMYVWWRDIIREGTIEGQHTMRVSKRFKNGNATFYCFRGNVLFCIFLGIFSCKL